MMNQVVNSAMNSMDRNSSLNLLQSTGRSTRPLRAIARIVLLVLINAVVWPSWAVAIELDNQKTQQELYQWRQDNQQLHQLLGNLRNHIDQQSHVIGERLKANSGFFNSALSFIGFGDAPEVHTHSQRFKQRLQEQQDDFFAALDEQADHTAISTSRGYFAAPTANAY